MTSQPAPWDDIRTPDRDYQVRLAVEAGNIPAYWGRDAEGNCLLIIRLEGENLDFFRKHDVSIQGIQLDLRYIDSSENLVLTLEQHVDRDLFSGLCRTLLSNLGELNDRSLVLAVTLQHIRRWKSFLSGKRVRMLSQEEIQGLFAELIYLRYIYSILTHEKAVDAWCGPQGIHQDFILAGIAVEVKSLSGHERSIVRISSEDQLESTCDRLFLVILHLDDSPESPESYSLNELVRLIEDELNESGSIDSFRSKLNNSGYVRMDEYDRNRFRVRSIRSYRVTENFPRIIRSCLPEGVTRVSYGIELEKILPFKCEPEEILKGTLDHD